MGICAQENLSKKSKQSRERASDFLERFRIFRGFSKGPSKWWKPLEAKELTRIKVHSVGFPLNPISLRLFFYVKILPDMFFVLSVAKSKTRRLRGRKLTSIASFDFRKPFGEKLVKPRVNLTSLC